jgi:hypothetical protein
MSKISVHDLKVSGVLSGYIAICTEDLKFYSVRVDDGNALPDGHPNKNLAVSVAVAAKIPQAIVAVLNKREYDLMATVVTLVVAGEIVPPHHEMRPISLLSKTEWGTWILNSGFDSELGNVFRKYMER